MQAFSICLKVQLHHSISLLFAHLVHLLRLSLTDSSLDNTPDCTIGLDHIGCSIFLLPLISVVKISDTTGPMESVAIERLKLWQKEFNGEIAQIIHLLEVK